MKYLYIAQSLFQKIPYAIFFVTSRCNSRCRMCFYWKNLNKDELNLSEIEKIAKNAGQIMHISISGGEPFLRDDLDEICSLFHNFCGTRFITIPTNCLLPKTIHSKVIDILNKCPGLYLTIELSLDGVSKVHDYIRGVDGNFDKVLDTYRLLKDIHNNNLKIQVNSVISKFNMNKIGQLKKFVKNRMEISAHALTIARGDTRETIARDVPLHIVEEAYKFQPAREGSVYRRLLEARYSIVKELTLKILKEKKMPIDCLAGRRMVVISETGKVYPCEMLNKPMGDLRKNGYNLRSILQSKEYKQVTKYIKDKKCYCTFECAIANSIIYDPKNYPALMKHYVNNRNKQKV